MLIPQVLTLKSTLLSLQSLLANPVPNDPQDAEGEHQTLETAFTSLRIGLRNAHSQLVAKHYLTDRKSFEATAKHWAQAYAQAPASKSKSAPGKQVTDAEMAGLSEASVQAFTDMGFERPKVVRLQCEREESSAHINRFRF